MSLERDDDGSEHETGVLPLDRVDGIRVDVISSARQRRAIRGDVYVARFWQYSGITMPTITIKLDKRRAARLARWARRRKVPKSDVIRALIDRAGPIETGEDLTEWVEAAVGKGLGLAQQQP